MFGLPERVGPARSLPSISLDGVELRWAPLFVQVASGHGNLARPFFTHGVVVFAFFPCLPGEAVSISIRSAWSVADCEVERLETQGPSRPPAPSVLHRIEPLQALVISDDVERHSRQVDLEVPDAVHYSEAFFVHSRVVFLRRTLPVDLGPPRPPG